MNNPVIQLQTTEHVPVVSANVNFDLLQVKALVRSVNPSPLSEALVVVKRARCDPGDQPTIQAYTAVFQQLAAQYIVLDHEHICQGFGVYLLDGLPAIGRPFYPYGHILEYINTGRNVDKRTIILQTCRGIQYIHNLNIWHGDISSSAILIDQNGSVQITDIGVAWGMLTVTGKDGRDWRYRSPEELINSNPPSGPGDMFALGTTIFEVMHGSLPIRHTLRAFVREIKRIDAHDPRPALDSPGVDANLLNLINLCRADILTNRPAIAAFIAGLPLLT